MKTQSISSSSSSTTDALPLSTSQPIAPSASKDTIVSIEEEKLQQEKMTNSLTDFFVAIGKRFRPFITSVWHLLVNICSNLSGQRHGVVKIRKEDDKSTPVQKKPVIETPPTVNETSKCKEAVANYDAILVAVKEQEKVVNSTSEIVEQIHLAILQNLSQEQILDLITGNEEISQHEKESMSRQLLDDFKQFKENISNATSELRNFFHVESLKSFLKNSASSGELLAVFNKLPQEVRDAIVKQYSKGNSTPDVSPNEGFLKVLAGAEGAKILESICNAFPSLNLVESGS